MPQKFVIEDPRASRQRLNATASIEDCLSRVTTVQHAPMKFT